MSDISTLYHSLTGEMVGGLFKQLVFFGFFSCCLIFVRRSLLDSTWTRSTDCFRHLAIFASVTLFTLYISLTYEIESYQSIQYGKSESHRLQSIQSLVALKGAEWDQARALLLVMLPIDLLALALNSSLFAIVIWTSANSENWNGRNTTTIRMAMRLLGVAALWHVTMAVWWSTYIGISGSGQSIFENKSIGFHLLFASMDVALALLIYKLVKSRSALNRSAALANLATCIICLDFATLYVVRLWDYVNRFRTIVHTGDL